MPQLKFSLWFMLLISNWTFFILLFIYFNKLTSRQHLPPSHTTHKSTMNMTWPW